MKRFISDILKFRKYVFFQAKQDLKTEVARSYLNWMWWILDPMFHMLIYSFVSIVVFKAKEPYFPVYVFIGLAYWEFFNRMIMQSVKIIISNRAIVTKVYLPKYVLILSKLLVNGFKMGISLGLIVIMMLFYRIPISINILFAIPITVNVMLITFGFSTIISHCGVYIDDLQHVIEIVLKFLFYFTGIFYSIKSRVPEPFSSLLIRCNPIAYHIDLLREVLLFDSVNGFIGMLVWTVIALLCSIIGIKTIYKYENTYVKVI